MQYIATQDLQEQARDDDLFLLKTVFTMGSTSHLKIKKSLVPPRRHRAGEGAPGTGIRRGTKT